MHSISGAKMWSGLPLEELKEKKFQNNLFKKQLLQNVVAASLANLLLQCFVAFVFLKRKKDRLHNDSVRTPFFHITSCARLVAELCSVRLVASCLFFPWPEKQTKEKEPARQAKTYANPSHLKVKLTGVLAYLPFVFVCGSIKGQLWPYPSATVPLFSPFRLCLGRSRPL